MKSGTDAKINNTNNAGFRLKTYKHKILKCTKFSTRVERSKSTMVQYCKLERNKTGHVAAPLARRDHRKSKFGLRHCIKPGCIVKSNTNNLPPPTDLTKNPYGKKKFFCFGVSQKSASVVQWGIAVEFVPRRRITPRKHRTLTRFNAPLPGAFVSRGPGRMAKCELQHVAAHNR
jgi:hypothetical protein